MKSKRWLSIIIAAVLLSTLLAGLSTAQDPQPVPEEPGRQLDPTSPPPGPPAPAGAGLDAWAFSGGPNYDSGWVALEQAGTKTLNHNLGGDVDNYVVDMQYRNSGTSGVNQRYYGGSDFGANAPSGMNNDDRVGAYWRSLDTSSITVFRRNEDIYAEHVRVRIWSDPYPNYDSGWIQLTPGAAATTLNHGLGGDSDDYVVDMQYRSSGSGVNQRYYGGVDFGATSFGGSRQDDHVALYWRSLDNASISLYRRAEDDYADDVRVRIWLRPTPTYDSGWVALNHNTAQTLNHNIGGHSDDYVVDMQYRSPGNGVNQRYYGGTDFGADPPSGMNADDRVGAYWRTLTHSSITVYRRPEDIYAEEVRIRIWCFWDPPVPDYDSGWVSQIQGEPQLLTHNVGGNVGDYLVNMEYRSSGSGINQRYYGGSDFGATAFGGAQEDNRTGAYWRSLTDSTLTVYRRLEDVYAADIRVRIWIMPKPDYDSAWVTLAQDTSQELTHDLGGDYMDYMVDMQYRTSGSSGINQRYYGGADFGANVGGSVSEDDRVGAYWRSLDLESITVYRRPEDLYAEEVRVRIWRMGRPDYESGWQVVDPDSSETWIHGIGGNPKNYFVDMVYYDDVFNHINQRHFGGADFGANPPSGYNEDDRVGAYWRSLTNDTVTVYRRPEDGFVDYLRIRIWATPTQVFLPLVFKNN